MLFDETIIWSICLTFFENIIALSTRLKLFNFKRFLFFNLFEPDLAGIIIIFDIKLNKEGVFISASLIPIKQIGEGIPIFDNSKGAWNYIVNLSKEDFPESPLTFDDNQCLILKSK